MMPFWTRTRRSTPQAAGTDVRARVMTGCRRSAGRAVGDTFVVVWHGGWVQALVAVETERGEGEAGVYTGQQLRPHAVERARAKSLYATLHTHALRA